MRTMKLPTLIILIIGDALVVFAVTLFGFFSHNQSLTNLRWMTTFLPVVLAWGLIAPWFGLYHPEVIAHPSQVWRIVPVLLLATPPGHGCAGTVVGQTNRMGIRPGHGRYLIACDAHLAVDLGICLREKALSYGRSCSDS